MNDAAHRAGQECLLAALDYLARGWSVLGLCPPDHVGVGRAHGKSCTEPGKRPWPNEGRWKEYQDRLPTEDEVQRWWQEHPLLNVGAALGPVSGLVRIDVDGAGGEAALDDLSGGDLPLTLEFLSGRPDGGRGLLYAIPGDAVLKTTVRHEPGAELRLQTKGAQTVLPPSRHVSGGRYAWVAGRGPGEIRAAGAPGWLLAALSPDRRQTAALPLAEGEVITQPGRNSFLASLAGSMRRRGMHEEAIRAALDVMNQDRCEPPLPDAEVAGIARKISRYAPVEFVNVVPRAEASDLFLLMLREALACAPGTVRRLLLDLIAPDLADLVNGLLTGMQR